MTRRDEILAAASDAAVDFIAYVRKEDEDLPLFEIESAVGAGEISIDEIVGEFRSRLVGEGKWPDGCDLSAGEDDGGCPTGCMYSCGKCGRYA